VGLIDVHRASSDGRKRGTDRAGGVRISCNLQGIFLTPTCSPSVGTARQHFTTMSCELSSKVRCIGMLPQQHLSCGRPTDKQLFARYIRAVRVTASWGISPPPPAIEISTPQEIIVTFPHPPLFSHDGYCLGVDVKPSLLHLWGPAPPLLGVLVLVLC